MFIYFAMIVLQGTFTYQCILWNLCSKYMIEVSSQVLICSWKVFVIRDGLHYIVKSTFSYKSVKAIRFFIDDGICIETDYEFVYFSTGVVDQADQVVNELLYCDCRNTHLLHCQKEELLLELCGTQSMVTVLGYMVCTVN